MSVQTQTTTRTTQGKQPMRVRIAISETGRIGFFTESGTFADGNVEIDKLLAMLGAEDLDFASIGIPEQHRHDGDPEMVLSDAHALSHATE